jgi:hypothetical protein
LGAAALLTGCAYVTDAIFPGSAVDESAAPAERIEIAPSQTELAAAPTLTPTAPPTLGSTSFGGLNVTPGQSTGTFVGQRVTQIRGDLAVLQRNIIQRNQGLQVIRIETMGTSQRYHGTVAAISTRLQIGTTPGNPVLVDQWNLAQTELDGMGEGIARMNTLANTVANDSAFAAFLLESVRATYGLAGAIDEDHRQLAILEDETNRTVVLIDRLLNELSEDVSRQTAYVGNERSNLTTLSLAIKNGELLGRSLANRAFASAAPIATQAPVSNRTAASSGRRPLVVIRFDRPDVPFEQALYTAINRALEARPNSQFDLVAVTPNQGSPADVALNTTKSKRNAETVFRALIDMGLPAGRISLSSSQSPEAFTNEVHIYLR